MVLANFALSFLKLSYQALSEGTGAANFIGATSNTGMSSKKSFNSDFLFMIA